MSELALLDKLVNYPHAAVFNKAADEVGAFRLRHANSAKWTISRGSMSIVVGTNDPIVIDLRPLSVHDLTLELRTRGFEVLAVDLDMSLLSALVLMDRSGDQATSNGDIVYGYRSLMWVIFSAYAIELGLAADAIVQALRQMIITQAEGYWLDVWGTLYGIKRKVGESDSLYAARIPREAFRIRVNARAIELAILEETGFDVRILEPWKEVFTLDYSILSGPDHFYDGSTTGYHIIQPVSKQNVDWDAVLKVIERNRAAGIVVLPPETFHVTWIDASYFRQVHAIAIMEYYSRAIYDDRILLDYNMILDDNSMLMVNHTSAVKYEYKYGAHVSVQSQGWEQSHWYQNQTWADEYVVHSNYTANFETYYLALEYKSDTWRGPRQWSNVGLTWDDAPVRIGSAYTPLS